MFLARVFFFRIHESPRFLVHTGREEEAAVTLTDIANFNGDRIRVTVADVKDDEEDDIRDSYDPSGGHGRDSEEREGLLEHSPTTPTTPSATQPPRTHLRRSSVPPGPARVVRRWIGKPLEGWYGRVSGLLTGEWRTRTLLIWGIWMSMALGKLLYQARERYSGADLSR
jgi:hypothetical protein